MRGWFMSRNIPSNINIPFLTGKMKMLYMDVIASLGQLPLEQRGYIFGFDGEEDYKWRTGVAEYIIFEYIKYSFDYDDPEYPLNHFVEQENDCDRMLQSRIMQYVVKHKNREIVDKNVILSPEHKLCIKRLEWNLK